MLVHASNPVKPITHATPLGAELRRLLKGLQYNGSAVRQALEWIDDHQTVTGCPAIDPEDLDAVRVALERHTGWAELEPEDWPAWTDEGQWVPSDAVDAPPLTSEPLDESHLLNALPYEPSVDDERAAAAVLNGGILLDPFVAPDERPVRIRPGDVGTPAHDRAVATRARVDALTRRSTCPHTDREIARIGAV